MLDFTGLGVVQNYGTIIGQVTGDAPSTRSGGDDVRVENFGIVTGNVMLVGMNSSYFFNHAGRLFNAGEQVFVMLGEHWSFHQRRHHRAGRPWQRPGRR